MPSAQSPGAGQVPAGHNASHGTQPGDPAAGRAGGPGSPAGGIAASSTHSGPGTGTNGAGAIGQSGSGGLSSSSGQNGSGQSGSSAQSGSGHSGSSGKASGSGSGGGTGSGGGAGGGSIPPPIGYRWLSVPAASSGTAAGFKIAVPESWQVTRQGLAWYATPTAGSPYIEVSLVPFSYAKPVNQARSLQATAISQHEYPGYQRVAISPATYRGVPAATWRFNWRQHGAGHVAVLELLFSLATPAGGQDYDLTVSASALGFPAARAVFEESLRTFRRLT